MKKISILTIILLTTIIILSGCGTAIKETSTSIVTSTTVATTSKKDLGNLEVDNSKKEDSSITETTTTTTALITNEDLEDEVVETITQTTLAAAPATVEIETYTNSESTENKVTNEQEETTSQIEEYIVYKPSTHYIHKSTCRWVTSECYEISDTNNIEARKCSECKPDMEIITEYKEVVTTTTTTTIASNDTTTSTIDSYSRQLLAEIVWHEAGSDYISQYEKARIAAGVMNRVKDSRFPNTVYGVLTQSGQFSGYWPGSCTPTQACYDAVDYYFAHTNEFGNENSWYGDGRSNHFYYQ